MNNKGVTLVELLIYLGLSMMMLLVLSELFVSILDESVETQNYSIVQTDGRYIMTRLRYQINNADSVLLPANLGDSSDELRLSVGGVEQRYYTVDDQLFLNDGSGEYLMSHPDSKVTDIVFVRHGNIGGKAIIDISFKVSTGVAGTAQYETQIFKGTGGLR